jgi:hypothetical protein
LAGMVREGCTAAELSAALNRALADGILLGTDMLIRNQVGNLAVERDGEYIGFVDLMFGEVTVFDGDDAS